MFCECDHRADELIGLKVDVPGEFIVEFELVFVQEPWKRSLCGSFLRARRDTLCRELKCAILSAANPKVRTAATTRIAPVLPRRAPSRVGRLSFSFVNGGSTSRLLYAKPTAPTQLGENEHDDPHILIESHVVIITDTDPIDSRARGVGWVAWFDLALRKRARLGGMCQKAP